MDEHPPSFQDPDRDTPTLDDLRQRVESVCRSAGVIENAHFKIDRVWQDPSYLHAFVDAVSSYLLATAKGHPFEKIVMVDSIGPLIGALPIGGLLSVAISKPLVIWKESPALLSVKPRVFNTVQNDEPDVPVAVVYCATSYGRTAANVVQTLVESRYRTVLFLAIVDWNKGADARILAACRELGLQTKFDAILNAPEMIKAAGHA